jgi:hypothetical protein
MMASSSSPDQKQQQTWQQQQQQKSRVLYLGQPRSGLLPSLPATCTMVLVGLSEKDNPLPSSSHMDTLFPPWSNWVNNLVKQ